jgi:hypothetical protein
MCAHPPSEVLLTASGQTDRTRLANRGSGAKPREFSDLEIAWRGRRSVVAIAGGDTARIY